MKFFYKVLIALAIPFWVGMGALSAQDLEVSGKVTDAKDGSGLPGVNVLVVGGTTGTSTDINGNFKLKASTGAVLEFRFLGYTTERRTVSGSGSIEVSMKEEVKNLKEAVVIGYGTVNKKDLTGSITNVTSKDFQTGVISSPEQLIAGKAPGVQITSNSGAPGSSSTIRIRGGASLTASNDPLIVIDGVPVDNGGIAGSPNALSLINPNDIESFTVLKDAAATAIYGSRASNGVIIITTKKSAKGQKPAFSVSSNNSLSVIARQVEVLSADEFRKVVNEFGSEDQKKLLGNASTDWQKQIFRPAFSSDNSISYGGDLNGMPIRISGGFFNQQGILKRDVMDRQTLGVNVNPTLLDGSLKLDVSLKGSRSSNMFANGGAIGAAITFDPTQPVFNESPNGRYGNYFEWLSGDGRPNTNAGRNPLGLLYQRENRSEVFRGIGNIKAEYAMPFLPDLKATVNFGFDRAEGSGREWVSDSAAVEYYNKGLRNRYRQQKNNEVVEAYLNYGKDLTSINSRIDLMAGGSYQNFAEKNFFYRRLTYRSDTLPQFKAPLFPFDIPQNRLASFFGRAIYTYKAKYFLQGTLRYDGSSRFAPENRWGLFPSVAASYRLTEESFMKDQTVLSNLKIRASWGVTGQQDVGANYSYQSYFNISNNNATYPFGDIYWNMARPGAYDPNRRWESTTTYNAGIDFGFLSDRFYGSIDVYQKFTKDLLNSVPTAAGSNFGDNVISNVGSMENKGIEVALNGAVIQTERVRLDLGINGTYNVNKITRLNTNEDPNYPGVPTGGISGGIGNTIQIQSVGYPINSFFVYKQVYDANGKPVEGVFEDLNGDGKLNEQDRYRFKRAAPLAFYGFNANLSVDKFFVGFVIRANTGNYVYNNVYSNNGARLNMLAQQSALSNASINYLETGFTGASLYGNDDKRLLSDYYVTDASFVRMDNLNFGYNLGNSLFKDVNLAITGNIQNVFVLTKYKGIDPELSGGIDNNFYPRPRVFVLGVRATF